MTLLFNTQFLSIENCERTVVWRVDALAQVVVVLHSRPPALSPHVRHRLLLPGSLNSGRQMRRRLPDFVLLLLL